MEARPSSPAATSRHETRPSSGHGGRRVHGDLLHPSHGCSGSDRLAFSKRFAFSGRLAVAPNPPPPGPHGSQAKPSFHGDKNSLYLVDDTTQPAGPRLLIWNEAGT